MPSVAAERYDGLVEDLGGPSTGGIGFALGLDRTLIACDDEGVFAPSPTPVDVFVVDTAGGLEALIITQQLRESGISSDRSYENKSMKSQMKAADKSGARIAIIIGSDEVSAQSFVLRPLRGDEQQSTISRSELIPSILKALS